MKGGFKLDNDIIYTMLLQGGFLLYVQVEDEDTGNDNDHVDDIFIDMLLATSASFTVSQTFIGEFSRGRLELIFRVQCSPGITGENCAIQDKSSVYIHNVCLRL